jgi:predicted ATPase/class 3 adenylate cyclase
MTLTFLFTDIEGSSPLRERMGERYFDLAALHGRLLRAAFAARGGEDKGAPGDDSLFVVFPRATDAVAAAVEGQRALMAHPWPEDAAIRVRIGMHTAEAVVRDGIYDSVGINYARRICDAGHGGQILLSQTTRALVDRGLPEGAALRDMAQHRFKGLEAPEHLFQVLHPDLPAEFPPLRTLDARPNNLPSQWTRFIGREHTLAEVRELLAANRLLTLTGAGGSGKTRLALHVAAELLEQFPNGVWLVELAALTDPDLVAPTVLSTLGAHRVVSLDMHRTPQQPPITALAEALRTQALLLLLDNCEHVLASCADLCDALLRNCPNLRILATSREALGLTGEQTYRVPSLSLPAIGVQVFRCSGVQDEPEGPPEHPNTRTPEHPLLQYEAIRLFVDRATLMQPAFALTSANAAAVVQVCRRLDGIPLAIELAAARVRAMRVEQIATRLDDQFRLLTGGSRTALPRQQTLRALIDWSYDLLSEPERALLRRLAAFAGGWTLEAAEAICDFRFWILDF